MMTKGCESLSKELKMNYAVSLSLHPFLSPSLSLSSIFLFVYPFSKEESCQIVSGTMERPT